MIDGPIVQLRRKLDDLDGVIVAAQALKDYLGNNSGAAPLPAEIASVVDRYRGLRLRSFESDAGLVLLYGAMEKFVEDSVRGVLLRFGQRLLFGELPEKIRQEHLRKSVKLMADARALDRLRETDRLVLERTWQCESGAHPYQLNIGAFTIRDSNVRPKTIDQMFAGIGCENACVRSTLQRPFCVWHNAEFGLPPSDRAESNLALLSELVERRNEVAHGAATSSLALPDLLRMVNLVRAFGESLHLVAREHLVLSEGAVRGETLPSPIAIYDNHVVCFRIDGMVVKTGDWLIATDGHGDRRCGRVEEIQVSRRTVSLVDGAAGPIDVALRVDMVAKDGWSWKLVIE